MSAARRRRRAVGAVAVDRPGSSQGDPQHAFTVDGHAVWPELLAAEIEEPPAAADGARRGVRSKTSTTQRGVSAR